MTEDEFARQEIEFKTRMSEYKTACDEQGLDFESRVDDIICDLTEES